MSREIDVRGSFRTNVFAAVDPGIAVAVRMLGRNDGANVIRSLFRLASIGVFAMGIGTSGKKALLALLFLAT